jgi:hypothetical protein
MWNWPLFLICRQIQRNLPYTNYIYQFNKTASHVNKSPSLWWESSRLCLCMNLGYCPFGGGVCKSYPLCSPMLTNWNTCLLNNYKCIHKYCHNLGQPNSGWYYYWYISTSPQHDHVIKFKAVLDNQGSWFSVSS